MLIQRAYKFRLKPNERQIKLLPQIAGSQRFIWNRALVRQKLQLDNKLPVLKMGNKTQGMRQVYYQLREEHPFLKDIPQESADHTLTNQYQALMEAFDPKNPKRFPRFKAKGKKDSFKYGFNPKVAGKVCKLDQHNHCIYLSKIGWVKYFKNHEVLGAIKSATVSLHAGDWYVSIQVEIDVPEPVHPSLTEVAIDRGVAVLAMCSDGKAIEPRNSLKQHERRLARVQKRLSKKVGPNKTTGQKASENWKKQKRKVQRIYTQIANARKDHIHKATNTISQNHGVVYLENLQVVNMTASAKGTPEKPGKHVKQKAGLNKAILDQGWSEMRRQLDYKQKWRGGKVQLVPAAYTSQRCFNCGHTAKENRTTQAAFKCTACGHTDHADLNAAKNILAAGQAVSARGADVRPDNRKVRGQSRKPRKGKKQEPTMSAVSQDAV